jgi:hypothetical protein
VWEGRLLKAKMQGLVSKKMRLEWDKGMCEGDGWDERGSMEEKGGRVYVVEEEKRHWE